jgi:pyruvate kinase
MHSPDTSKKRLTKIVCTLGPASFSPQQIRILAEKGMNVARVNVSHGTRKDHERILRDIRVLHNSDFHIATLIDTRGAEIRTGDVLDPIVLTAGEEVIFSPTTVENTQQKRKVIDVGYDGFSADVAETDRILIDNGEMSFTVVSIEKNGTVIASADQDGSIGSRRHINLPGADIDLPSVTEKDWDDIAFATENAVDFVALSFIRNKQEVEQVRDFLVQKKSSLQIITKVETRKAVENIAEIIQASDGIMIARGDLGAEVPYENLPVIQDAIIRQCREAGKPVIVATHMLESMTQHPIPTRAEVTDVAHAAMQRTDATMLSGETASGKHPALAVTAMEKILCAAEAQLAESSVQNNAELSSAEAYALSAVSLARSSQTAAILVFTVTGQSAKRVSKCRPNVPIITLSPDNSVLRKTQLHFGTYPIHIAFGDIEETVVRGMEAALTAGYVQKGDSVIILSDTKTLHETVTSIQIRTIG